MCLSAGPSLAQQLYLAVVTTVAEGCACSESFPHCVPGSAQLTKPGPSAGSQLLFPTVPTCKAGPIQSAVSSAGSSTNTLSRMLPSCWRHSLLSHQAPGAARARGTSPSQCQPHTVPEPGTQDRANSTATLKNDPQVTPVWVSNSSARLFHTEANTLQVQRVYSRCVSLKPLQRESEIQHWD